MAWIGYVAVTALTLLALAASLAVALRARFAGRAELAVAVALGWNALILAPIYGLGFTHVLTARSLAAASAILSGGVLALAGRGAWDRLPRAALQLAWLPVDGLRAAWRARSLSFLGVAAAGTLIAWVTLGSWFLPAWRGWDALWYHEPIIGFTIQNHGLQVIPIPFGGLQKINGYPKAAEMTALWFTIFTDRRLIELSSCLVAPVTMVTMYAIARRYSENAVSAMGWASALILMPATAQELQSNYIDLSYAWALLVTVYFALRPTMRMRDALYCGVAATLLVGTKGLALLPAPMLLLIALYRLIDQNPGRRWAVFGTAAFGATLVLSMLGSVYLRNFLAFHNPLWPDMKLDIPKLHIHFPGIYTPGEREGGRDGLDMNEDWGQFVEDVISAPYSWHRWHYGDVHDYGFASPWLLWPLGMFAMVASALAVVRGALARTFNQPTWRVSNETKNIAILIVPVAAIIFFSPARWGARYHIGTTALMMAFCAWASGRRGFARLGEGATAVMILSGIATTYWSQRWWVWPKELVTLSRIPYPAREVTPAGEFTTAFFTTGSCTTTKAGLAREKELHDGDVVVFPDAYGNFPALFWNNHFSNKVVWVPEGDDYIPNAEKAHATWIYVGFNDPNFQRLQSSATWEEVATLNVENWGAVFRRKK